MNWATFWEIVFHKRIWSPCKQSAESRDFNCDHQREKNAFRFLDPIMAGKATSNNERHMVSQAAAAPNCC
jgi:hypothetical protein